MSLLVSGAWQGTLLAAGITHTVVNIIPATQFGGGDDADASMALPARQLTLDGRGKEVILTSLTASIVAGLLAWKGGEALAPFWQPSLSFLDTYRKPVLLLFVAWSIGPCLRTRNAWIAVLLAVGLGITTTNIAFSGPAGNQALLPLLTGLFATPILLQRLASRNINPGPKRMQWRHVRNGILDAAPLATLTSMLPGITSGVAARMTKDRGPMHHVAKISALNTIHAILALHIVTQTDIVRTGLAQHATPVQWNFMPLALALGGLATISFSKVNLRSLQKPVLGLLILLTLALTGWQGLMIWLAASCLGVWTWGKTSPAILTACLWGPILL